MRAVFALFCLLFSACAFLARPRRLPPMALPSLVFQSPLKEYKLTQKFSARKSPPHLGLDLKAPFGAPVFSSHAGRVIYAGRGLSGYGNVVVLEHASRRWASLYAHLDSFVVKTGETAPKGVFIGTVGRTGRATGPHLHFELLRDKKAVDPLLFLPQLLDNPSEF